MIVTGSIADVRRVRRYSARERVGFVPTMGYLHDGHISLAERARSESDLVVASIYVNPTQFAPTEDLDRYPRDLERDLTLLDQVGTDLVFVPENETMYPEGYQTVVSVNDVTQPLEGSTRPTHFAGVTTVLTKLFNIIQPTHVYFGQKDAQQTVVVRQMAIDLNFPLQVIVCPTVREPDGLAMSSRNTFLNGRERTAAPVLFRALSAAEEAWLAGEHDAVALRTLMQTMLAAEPLAKVDYVSIANPRTLVEWTGAIDPDTGALASLAVRFGHTRLIDNILLS